MPLLWLLVCVAIIAILSALPLSPASRRLFTGALSTMQRQAEKEFSTPTPRAGVCLLQHVDNSGSSKRAKASIAHQALALSGVTGEVNFARVWRYARSEELIYDATNGRGLKSVLEDEYLEHPVAKTRGTLLGSSLRATLSTIREIERTDPGTLFIITIGSDGGIEDVPEVRDLCRQLTKHRVLVFVHGVEIEQRLREQVRYALQPLRDAGLLIDANEKDFEFGKRQFEQRVAAQLKGATAVPAKGAAP